MSVWEPYYMRGDRFESRNLVKNDPEKLQILVDAWFEEAEKNWVVTLDDLRIAEAVDPDEESVEPKAPNAP
jgi:hypothetical protein